MPSIPVVLYPNILIQVKLVQNLPFKVRLRPYPTALITPLPPGTISLGTLYASNSVIVGNSTVNSTINSTAFSGTANNSIHFDGLTLATVQGQITGNADTAYANAVVFASNADNITTGTLDYPRLPANVVIWSNTNIFTAEQTFNANVTIGDSTVNTQINSTAIAVKSIIANGEVGVLGQILTSNGTGIYWSIAGAPFSNGISYVWSAPQIFNENVFVSNATLSIGNTTVYSTVNTTIYSGTANNANNLGGSSLATIQGQITGNAATAYSNAVADAATSAAGIYQTTAGLAANVLTLTANNANNLNGQNAAFYTNATNINAGTLDFARLPANAVFWSNTNTFTAVQTLNQNLIVNSATLSVGNTTSNVTANTTHIVVGNSTVNVSVNSTVFSGTSNNTLNLGGVAAASYVNTSGAYTITGVHTLNANLVVNSAVLHVGNTTANVTTNTTHIVVGNSTVNVSVNSTTFSGTANNATNLGGTAASGYQTTAGLAANVATLTSNNASNFNGQSASFYANATNLTTGLVNTAQLATSGTPSGTTFLRGDQVWATPAGGGGGSPGGATGDIQFNDAGTFQGSANLKFDNATTFLTIGNNATNTQINSSSIALRTLIANGGVGSSGQVLTSSGTGANLYWQTLSTFSTSTPYTFTAVQTFNANVFVNAAAVLSVGNTTANITANTTHIVVGNSTVNVSINSTAFSGISNNANNLGGQLPAFYTNATNITAGTLDFARLPANAVFWSNTNTFTAVQTLNQNLIVNSATLSVGNTTANITANTTVLTVGNTTVNVTINSTAFSGTANNANNLGGQLPAFYTNADNIATGTVPVSRLPANIVFWSNTNTFTAVQTFNQNLIVNSAVFSVGNTIANVTANTTEIRVGNSTVNVSINSTAFSGTSANATNLNNQPGSFYTNATNLATGTVPTARLATGTANTTTFLRGDQAWAVPPGGGGGSPGGSTGDIQFNDSGAFQGSANLKFDNATTLLAVGNNTVNTQINSSSIAIRTLIANGGVGSSGQVLTSSGSGANIYWSTPTGGGGGLSDSYETVNKNLKAYDAAFSYVGGILQTITYTIPPSSSIVKTFNYTGGVLTSIVLSGATPGGIDLTKTFGYTGESLTSITYT